MLLLTSAIALLVLGVVLFLALRLRRREEQVTFVIEDKYTNVPEIRVARQRAMAVPRKRPALRTRNSR